MRLFGQKSSFVGSLLGLALGDAVGAPREGGALERTLWRVIGKTSEGWWRYTDDTQMALDLAESLIACRSVDQDDIARRFASGYRWSRAAAQSCVTAIYIALRFRDESFRAMLDFVAACRGDVDTIGAMAGAIWGARNGDAALPRDKINLLEDHERLRQVASDLYSASCQLPVASAAEPRYAAQT